MKIAFDKKEQIGLWDKSLEDVKKFL